MSSKAYRRLVFEDGYDEEDDRARGYRTRVWAEMDDGAQYGLSFFDPVRLSQELQCAQQSGMRYFTEPGLIIVPEVTLANMEAAAKALAEEGFFEKHLTKA